MKDILLDIVTHTYGLGFITLLKLSSDEETTIEALSDDRSVILIANTHIPVKEFSGTFGMPNLEKLTRHLKNPEYQEDAKIQVVSTEINGESVPTHLHFENSAGDYQNDYRFMNKKIIDEKIKSIEFQGARWNVDFEPSLSAIQRLKLMSAAHNEESLFTVKTVKQDDKYDLVFYFGDAGTHSGNFVFQSDVGPMVHTFSWSIDHVQSILNSKGDIQLSISDQGVMKITVNSGLILYDFYLPAKSN